MSTGKDAVTSNREVLRDTKESLEKLTDSLESMMRIVAAQKVLLLSIQARLRDQQHGA